MKAKWWCYLHVNGHIQAKPYLDSLDLKDADESTFVKVRSNPFMASGRDDAIKQFHEHLVAKKVVHELTKNYGLSE